MSYGTTTITVHMDLWRLNSGPCVDLSSLPFEGQGFFVSQCRMFSTRIIKSIDVLELSRKEINPVD